MMLHRTAIKRNATKHIQLDPGICKACWKCIEVCPEGVIGRINLPFHKHAKIDQADRCKGCRKCVKACPEKAITPF